MTCPVRLFEALTAAMTVPVRKAGPLHGSAFFTGKAQSPGGSGHSPLELVEFTVVGIARTLLQPLPVGANVLTLFRESPTLGRRSGSFSRPFPRPRKNAVFVADNRQTAFLRHFSVMRQGIKTYGPAAIKMLSGVAGSLNTVSGFGPCCPRISPIGHKI